jgi:putative transcriptional regulator
MPDSGEPSRPANRSRAVETTRTHRREACAAIHEAASDLHDAGMVDKRTLRRCDALCLTAVEPLSPEALRAIRERERVSQAVFARYLDVGTGLVSQWERGEKRPSGPALKLLALVERKGLGAIACHDRRGYPHTFSGILHR